MGWNGGKKGKFIFKGGPIKCPLGKWLFLQRGEAAIYDKLGRIGVIWKIKPPCQHYEWWTVSFSERSMRIGRDTSIVDEAIGEFRQLALIKAVLEMLKGGE